MGRPTIFTEELADAICKEVSTGKSLRQTCRELDIQESTVRLWYLQNYKGFSAQYARARELQMEAWADEITEIADDGTNDWMTIKRGGEDVEVPNPEVLQRSRLRVDTRKWIMSKIVPKKYGDKVTQEISGPEGGPIVYGWGDEKPKV
jgi:thiamine biosynthesis protein ThiC